MRILHVTECYGGGVSKAINTFTDLAPEEVDHVLLWAGEDKPETNRNFSTTRMFSKNPLQRILDVRRLAQTSKADFILAHSSWAGFYSRLALRGVPIIYQPHCYVFEDKSRNKISRLVYYLAEKLLTLNTTATVVLSPREQYIANKLNRRMKTVMLPNVNSLGVIYRQKGRDELVEEISKKSAANPIPQVAMLGRISRQKDPDWMVSFVNKYREKYPLSAVEFTWIGDGDSSAKSKLRAAGINVTGWKSSSEIADIFKRTDVYLHTAYYEGFPLAVLDALSLDIPTLVREIPAYEGTPLEKVDEVEDATDCLYKLIGDIDAQINLILKQRKLMEFMNQEKQSEAIKSILRLI